MRYKYNATYLSSTYQPSLTTTHNYATPTVFTYFHYYYYHVMIQRVHQRLPGRAVSGPAKVVMTWMRRNGAFTFNLTYTRLGTFILGCSHTHYTSIYLST